MINLKIREDEVNCLELEGLEKGIFFRSPFYYREYDVYEDDIYGALKEAKAMNTITGFIHGILNSYSKLVELEDVVENNSNIAGIMLKSLRSPIYFKRYFRSYIVKSRDGDLSVISKGYHDINERTAGHCEKEVTLIKLNGVKQKVIKTRQYHFTYEHNVLKLLKDTIYVEEKA